MIAALSFPATWTTGTTEGIHTGTWRAATPRHIAAPSPCHQACPVGADIAKWIGQARAGDLHGAWQTLVLHNPFPAIAGRICHHPCEAACNRGGHDEALSICRLERFVGDAALAQGWAEGFLRDYADDIPVWEHKVFRATPALAEVDGPFARYRRWYAQFYA